MGVVDAGGLRALIDRRHPDSGEALGGGKQPRVRAIDATFSAPKGVSLLWAFADPGGGVGGLGGARGGGGRRPRLRRGQGGGDPPPAGRVRTRAGTSGWAAATFVHRTSRAGDPQLHTHAVIPNVVRRDDGTWVSLDATGLHRWAKAAGSVYQEQLRRLLTERLGVSWGPGSQRLPRDDRHQRSAAAGLLEADGPDRGAPRERRRLPGRAAGADVGGRGGQRGDPAGQGPHPHSRTPPGPLGQRSRGGRIARRGGAARCRPSRQRTGSADRPGGGGGAVRPVRRPRDRPLRPGLSFPGSPGGRGGGGLGRRPSRPG